MRWSNIVIDCRDAKSLSQWWGSALDLEVHSSDDGEYWVEPGGEIPDILFIEVPEEKTVKNRLHLDFRPRDQEAEVQRLIDLGAVKVDIGQGIVTWVVLADPEGNEFCVLRSEPEEG